MCDNPHPDALSLDDFARIVERLEHELLLFLVNLTRNEDQARDLLQDTFYDAWRAARRNKAPFITTHGANEIRRWHYHAAYCRANRYPHRDRQPNKVGHIVLCLHDAITKYGRWHRAVLAPGLVIA